MSEAKQLIIVVLLGLIVFALCLISFDLINILAFLQHAKGLSR